MENNTSIRYQKATERVKNLKRFYTHCMIYLVVNVFVFILNYNELSPNKTIFSWELWLMPIFWGIGLAFQACKTFLPNFILGSDWEARKTKDLVEKYK